MCVCLCVCLSKSRKLSNKSKTVYHRNQKLVLNWSKKVMYKKMQSIDCIHFSFIGNCIFKHLFLVFSLGNISVNNVLLLQFLIF